MLILLLVLGTYPIGALAALYSFALRARIQLGNWPAPYRPDPKSLGFDVHYLAVAAGLYGIPIIAAGCILGIIMARLRWREFPMWRMLVLTIACGAVALILADSDPGLFVEWFFD